MKIILMIRQKNVLWGDQVIFGTKIASSQLLIPFIFFKTSHNERYQEVGQNHDKQFFSKNSLEQMIVCTIMMTNMMMIFVAVFSYSIKCMIFRFSLYKYQSSKTENSIRMEKKSSSNITNAQLRFCALYFVCFSVFFHILE